MSRLTWKRSLRSFDSSWMETLKSASGGADADDAGGYAATPPPTLRDHAGGGGRLALGSADGGEGADGGGGTDGGGHPHPDAVGIWL